MSCATAHANMPVASVTVEKKETEPESVSCFLLFGPCGPDTFIHMHGHVLWTKANNMFDLTIQNRHHHQSGSHAHHEYVSV